MSERMTCPGCDAHSSSVLSAYICDKPCPFCGLSAQAIAEINQVRRRHANRITTDKLVETIKKCDVLEAENRQLKIFIEQICDIADEARTP